MELEAVYSITMWSGGRPAKKWRTLQKPEILPQGTGVHFVSFDTKLPVQVIGSVSVEEFEQGSDLFAKEMGDHEEDRDDGDSRKFTVIEPE